MTFFVTFGALYNHDMDADKIIGSKENPPVSVQVQTELNPQGLKSLARLLAARIAGSKYSPNNLDGVD
jgi:hypothetical protein